MTSSKIKYGLIPAAGAGKRLGYLSGLLPKAMFPIYDRPIIHYVVSLMQKSGVEEIFIVVNVKKEIIKEYFDLIKMDLRVKLTFLEQKELSGTGNAILMAEKHVENEPFMVIYGDDCTVTDSLKPMISDFYKNNAMVCELVAKEKDNKILQQTCSVKLTKSGKMIEIIEKPEEPPYKMRGCGVYIFDNRIFDYIRKTPIHPIRGEREITYTINMLAREGKAYGHVLNGHNININDSDQLLKANNLIKMLKSDTPS